jgi:hypothetical protein
MDILRASIGSGRNVINVVGNVHIDIRQTSDLVIALAPAS